MNKILCGIVIFVLSICALDGQITKTKVASPTDKIDATDTYDGTRNFLGSDVYQYIGQVLYLNEEAESLRKYGYDGFSTDYVKNATDSFLAIYKRGTGDSQYNSDYQALAGKYFSVLAVHKHPKAVENESLYGVLYYLELEEQASKDRVYYEYSSKYESSFPFIVTKFIEKQKETKIGKKFVITNKAFENTNDIVTGLPLTLTTGQLWTCNDITIDDLHYYLSIVVTSEKGEKALVPYYRISEDYNFGRMYSEEVSESNKKKFGAVNWEKILNGKVLIGFTEEMVRMSWGTPKEINHASYGDQWVYGDQYLYFEKGLLKAFN